MVSIVIAPARCAAALLLFLILWLTGTYLNLYFTFLFYFTLFLFLLSLLQALYSLVRCRFYQNFSTSHPVKGQDIHFTVKASNDGWFPFSPMYLNFRIIGPLTIKSQPRSSSFILAPGRRFERSLLLPCPYRGIYELGLEKIISHDYFGLVSFSTKPEYKTFYVMSRIIDITPRFPVRNVYRNQRPAPGIEEDPSLFRGLQEYRPGQPVKHMAWKKFQMTGQPFLKTYDTGASRGLCLLPDLRRMKYTSAGEADLETEDALMEILISLVKASLELSLEVKVLFQSEREYSCFLSEINAFGEFYQSTAHMVFSPHVLSPFVLWQDQASFPDDSENSRFLIISADPDEEDRNILLSALADPVKAPGLILAGRGHNQFYSVLREQAYPVIQAGEAEELTGWLP